MSKIVIPWNCGDGSITLTYNGQGDGSITFISSPNNLYTQRSQDIFVKTIDNTVVKRLTIIQSAKQSDFSIDFNSDFNSDFG